MKKAKHGWSGYGALGLAALFFDIAVKGAARFVLLEKSVPLVLGFRLELHVNPGVAFGLSRTLGWAVGLLGLAVLFGFSRVLVFAGRMGRFGCGLTLLWAGGLSNVLERLFLGGVTDFLFVPFPRLSFLPLPGLYVNLADLWLLLGTALLLWNGFIHENDENGGGAMPSADTRNPDSAV